MRASPLAAESRPFKPSRPVFRQTAQTAVNGEVRMSQRTPQDVFAIADSSNGQRAVWIKVGVAFTNDDNSLNILLNAVPLTGKLQVRRREQRGRRDRNDHEYRERSRRTQSGSGHADPDYPI